MSFRYISFLCYNTFRYIKFLFLLYWADDFLLYQFPFYCYIRIRYIRFRYINFLFLVISDSVTSNSVISISVFWLYQFPLYQSPLYQFPFFVTSDSVISVSWKNVTSHSVISNSVISTSPSPFAIARCWVLAIRYCVVTKGSAAGSFVLLNSSPLAFHQFLKKRRDSCRTDNSFSLLHFFIRYWAYWIPSFDSPQN